jgi:hypothetical protein
MFRSLDSRRTPEARFRQRQLALLSISAACLLVALGIGISVLQNLTAGLFCIGFGVLGLLLWSYLWPSYTRRGFV